MSSVICFLTETDWVGKSSRSSPPSNEPGAEGTKPTEEKIMGMAKDTDTASDLDAEEKKTSKEV